MKIQTEKVLVYHPINNLEARRADYYLGGRFYSKGKLKEIWVMTGNHLDLIPGPEASPLLV
ncbi:MAG: hypothetical protein HN392_11320 [Anaerolineae bacterium]|jgi:hypothetical protein|nr:hypothetical protein [Anaerolineae bacterium]